MERNGKVILITGASSGIGKSCATYLSERGLTVFGTSRYFPPANLLETNGVFYTIRMDVTSEESVNEAVQAILGRTEIDVLINNAGCALAGAIEDTSPEEALRELNTNFLGAHRVTRAVLPGMRKRRSGYIINISSLAGSIALPFQTFYSASKFALEAFTEALRMELRPFNIKVVSIQPNDYRTGLTDHRQKVVTWEHSAYTERAEKALAVTEAGERNGPSPEEIARLVEKIINKKSPRIRYQIGPNAKAIALARWLLPPRVSEKLVMKYFRI
ncbi:3-oxoacyl-[acyl-carrier protein] reductase [Candidatus Hakubella thermalkaliphila]|uniref:3-oxoacyl-[acyl-carrier protein] reductase n=1 Tax=Candidatus Hakubella thermalkaliphila TaxID=2754717 RepID=A0A6V8PJ22_9ACTN|nr:3-oxoacyl-[acyl-carrier protein] reductase [Candidatus Hakubella thermalkaliphila]GFP41510.1 3-oxoacyl-[acyl-carrier protein] reductase [Candidatus Hakubella thermalkaliphila]